MKYRKGYKYQCAETFAVPVNIFPKENIRTEFISLTTKGELTIHSGYASDGPSGPTIDRPKKHVVRGAFIHDALCQLLRMGLLPQHDYIIQQVHLEAYKYWVVDGMWKWRAKIWHRELRKFAGFAVDPDNVKEIYEAP